MEQLLNNTPIQWVQVTDPSTGRVYYAPDSYVYPFNDSERFTNIEGILVAGASSADTGSLLTTASFSDPNLEFVKGDRSEFSINLSSLTVTSSFTASYIDGGTF
jgi:hypothetical protein